MKDTQVGIEDIQRLFSEEFSTYQLTGERQQLLTGLFRWLKDNTRMSAGELRLAIREGFPEALEEERWADSGMSPETDPANACSKCDGFGEFEIKSWASGGTTKRVCRRCKGTGVDPDSKLAKGKTQQEK